MHDGSLGAEARTWLLDWARRTIECHLAGTSAERGDLPGGLEALRGCFVTLHTRSGGLRGCIGTFSESNPLWLNVRDMAIAAATRDPRFPPVTGKELADCVLEISVLTPRESTQPEDIEVGRHGVCVERGHHRGVLLPQVATDHGWDREMFLDHTCIKAGLPPDAWRDGTLKVETFSAEVFSEGH